MNKELFTSSLQNEEYKPIAKLFLTGTNRVITPWPLAKRQSWLDESPQTNTELVIEDETILELAELFCLNLKKKPYGRLPLLAESIVLDKEYGVDPKALYGKIENNGSLSIIAFFSDGEEEIVRTGHATVSNFEVEWVYSPLMVPASINNHKEDLSTTDNQTK